MTEKLDTSSPFQGSSVCTLLSRGTSLPSTSGVVVLVPTTGEPVWQPKTYEPFQQGPDSDYYLSMDKQTVLQAKWDMLGLVGHVLT